MKDNYPTLMRRYFATTLDVILVLIMTIFIVKMLDLTRVQTGPVWYIVFIPAAFYEPVLTSRFATLGQMVFKFRIRDAKSGDKINLIKAYVRLLIKFLLGVISMLTIPNDEKRRAIHDKLAATIAVNAKTLK